MVPEPWTENKGMKIATNPKRVRPILSGPNESITYLAVGMAETGSWSLEAIAAECQLSVSAVVYRLGLFGLNMRKVRDDRHSYVRRKMLKLVGPLTRVRTEVKADKIRWIKR